jgi:abnormal spindle-like microcephaly-associated protein
LQVHNVDLGLKALDEANFTLTGDITAKDIADGHREKTLSLLWQIIYKFRAPKFNAAATTIQLWWRHINLRVEIQRRIRIKRQLLENNAATRLQAYFKGIVTRKYFRLFREERVQAVVCLQNHFKRYLAMKRYRLIKRSVFLMQKWFRSVKITRVTRKNFVDKRNAAVKIQRWYRRQVLARKLLSAAPLIQGIRRQAELEYNSAVVLQRSLKSYTVRRKFRETVFGVVRFNRRKREKSYNATKIQSFVRMVKERREFLVIRKSTIVIQTHWRRYSLAKREHTEYKLLRTTTITVQRQFRAQIMMRQERRTYVTTRQTIVNVQQRFRANKAMVVQREHYCRIKAATVCLQQKLRAMTAMKREREAFLRLKSAAIVLQARFRARLVRNFYLL